MAPKHQELDWLSILSALIYLPIAAKDVLKNNIALNAQVPCLRIHPSNEQFINSKQSFVNKQISHYFQSSI